MSAQGRGDKRRPLVPGLPMTPTGASSMLHRAFNRHSRDDP